MKLYQGDCVEIMRNHIEDNSIDLTVTSPPYDNLRNYGHKNIEEIWNENIWKIVLKELYRVTKAGGVVVWVVGDATIKGSETGTSFKQALFAKECGFNLHDTMIYQKANPIPQAQAHRYTNSFEFMFVFSKGKPCKGQLIKVPTKSAGRIDINYRGQVNADGEYKSCPQKCVKKEKLKTNIWTYSQNNGIDRTIKHKAQFPERLAGDHIISWSNEGDIVFDPMMGSGTTGKMAILNDRDFIGIELNEEYFRIAENRINSQIYEEEGLIEYIPSKQIYKSYIKYKERE